LNLQKLDLEGAWKATLKTYADDRGNFREWFKQSEFLKATGRSFVLSQANFSVSKKNVLRGIHFSVAEVGQAKWVTCINGSVWDVLVDLRPSSPTFKQWVSINMASDEAICVFIPEGFGHGFLSLEENSTVVYFLTSEYLSEKEFEINPFDPDLNISWPTSNVILSEKDRLAPNLTDSNLF
jgi:dTDP-4-dehydrorhamnose 3,5-epimerase